jgi:hypothetical protein
MNRAAALRYLKVHQPDSPWSFEPPTKAQVRSHLQGLAARGAPADLVRTQAALLGQALQAGRKLPPHLVASVCHPRGVAKV